MAVLPKRLWQQGKPPALSGGAGHGEEHLQPRLGQQGGPLALSGGAGQSSSSTDAAIVIRLIAKAKPKAKRSKQSMLKEMRRAAKAIKRGEL